MRRRPYISLLIIALTAVTVRSNTPIEPGRFMDGNFYNRYGFRNPKTIRSSDVRDCSMLSNPYHPSTVTLTGDRIKALRDEMKAISRDGRFVRAYIIPSGDAHQSTFLADCDKRRHWMTGFDGTSGLAIVTHNTSALWTDSRYYIQAERQMDCNWILMRGSDFGVPDPWEWLEMVLPTRSDVAFDPKLLSYKHYNYYVKTFLYSRKEIRMYEYNQNLVDLIWKDRPLCPDKEPLFIMDASWAGMTWANKIVKIREEMRNYKVDMLVVHALDESAWLYNMRGIDIRYNPLYFSYTIITFVESIVFIQSDKVLERSIRDHLNLDDKTIDCSVTHQTQHCVKHFDYEHFYNELGKYASLTSIQRIWFSEEASYSIYSTIPELKRMMRQSPLMLMKSIKNPSEISGMKEGFIQDSVAMIELSHWLYDQVPRAKGDINLMSEMISREKAFEYRAQQPDFVMESFPPISAFGLNGAVVHYQVTPETNLPITNTDMYILDSGGQYKCGATTDIARTYHFGKPREYHKQAYTRVLKGLIDLSLNVFPERTYGSGLDSGARRYLWKNGWDYGHGTGHGIGACLSVHEGPVRFGKGQTEWEEPLYVGMFLSNEPGYYEENFYGVRLETAMAVEWQRTDNNYGNQTWMTFKEVAYVPFQYSLINFKMLSPEHIDWMNRYNQAIREAVGSRLFSKNKQAYDWMIKNTKRIYTRGACGATSIIANTLLVVALSLTAALFK
ncbi:xaa-Pro aminopeptidase 1-like [Ptychodera flava]|uniref:xaa-Pro aminopeptidase 1-like n=1 Tax=Ptychodera flava TaxID=63121 RepID=UPI00396A81C8